MIVLVIFIALMIVCIGIANIMSNAIEEQEDFNNSEY